MATVEIPIAAAGDDGYVIATGASYPPGGTPTPNTGASHALVAKSRTVFGSGSYYNSVGLVRFDTSIIDDDVTVTGAVLRLTVGHIDDDDFVFGQPNRNVAINWYDPGTIDAADYAALPANDAHTGTWIRSLQPGKPADFTLAGAATKLNKTGFTGLRIFISGGSPLSQEEFSYVQHPFDGLPVLIVTVVEPPIILAGGSGSGGGGASPMPTPPRDIVPWRVLLCDRLGQPIHNLTPVGYEREFTTTMNRPESVSFRIPSDDERIAGTHDDGHPLICSLRRTVKAYRFEPTLDGTFVYRLRFFGRIWGVTDVGDPEKGITKVTCLGPLRMKRRTPLERGYKDSQVSMIAKHMIDEANLKGATGLTTEGGAFEVTPTQTVTFSRRQISDALVELANSFNGGDIRVDPLDREDGVYGRLNVFARLGVWQPNLPFGMAAPPHNLQVGERNEDGSIVANDLIATGASGIESTVVDQASIDEIGLFEDELALSDITNRLYLEALAQENIRLRTTPRELVTWTPQTGVAWEPFVHYNLGDTVPVVVGERIRGGFGGIMRIYGFTIAIDDSGIERVTGITFAPESA